MDVPGGREEEKEKDMEGGREGEWSASGIFYIIFPPINLAYFLAVTSEEELECRGV